MIHTVDCEYLGIKEFAAAYLLTRGGSGVFIDNNTIHAVPRLMDRAAAAGLSAGQIQYVIVTHIHLDHAGGTAALMDACPAAVCIAHPKAVRHLADPSRLIAGTIAVYGEEKFRAMYGDIKPIDESRIRGMEDGEELDFQGGTLRFIHTRGHANHHFCIHDEGTDSIFTGDAFGLAFPLFAGDVPFVFPSSTPTDFDPAEARLSLDKIMATGATTAYPTHFGAIKNPEAVPVQMREHLDTYEKLLNTAIASDLTGDALALMCRAELDTWARTQIARLNMQYTDDVAATLEMDLRGNALGIAWQAEKRRPTT